MGGQQLVDTIGTAVMFALFLGIAHVLVLVWKKIAARFPPKASPPPFRKLTNFQMIEGLERIIADPSTSDKTRADAEVRLTKLRQRQS